MAFALHRMSKSKLISIALVIFGVISIGYLSLLYIPIALVEAKYQSLTLIEKLSGKRSFRSLIIPELELGDPVLRTASIEIPSLYIKEPVVFDVDPANKNNYSQALQKGIAHAQKTGYPGEGGLGYYFAHSSSPELITQYNAVFYLLNKLEDGDEIYVWRDDKKYVYTVFKKEITKPSYIDFVTDVYDDETIVLQTCWPPGTTSQRLLVFAELK